MPTKLSVRTRDVSNGLIDSIMASLSTYLLSVDCVRDMVIVMDKRERKRQTREKDKLPFGMLVSNKRTEFGKQLLFIPK